MDEDSTTSTLTWPPSYTLRVSQRARNWSLRIVPGKGLEVVVPRRFNLKRIPTILEEQRRWILRQLSKLRPLSPPTLPDHLRLPAIGEDWSIEYQHQPIGRIRVATYKNQRLVIAGQTNCIERCHTLLDQWLHRQAKKHLPSWLDQLSQETGLTYSGVTIRNQKTLWGSCTATNKINLNCKLLLLEKPLARYIMIHELCHTHHHNHSKSFWKLVKRFVPDCDALRGTLKGSDPA